MLFKIKKCSRVKKIMLQKNKIIDRKFMMDNLKKYIENSLENLNKLKNYNLFVKYTQ